jgi:catechol 2,3-dioxygenase-like lactoylglutathione lyase family enzyme
MITGMPRIAIAVRDFSAAVNTFRDKLGMPVIDISEGSVASLGANLAMCVPEGGSNIEIMSPADPAAPLSQSLERFLDRRGEGLFALMLEAADPNAEADELSSRGLNVLPLMAGASGRDIHPNATHGVLIRVYPVDSFQRPPEPAAGSGSAGLSGIQRVIVAVHDLDHATHVYGTQLAMGIDAPSADPGRGVRCAICHPPTGGVIELVAVEDSSQPFAKSVAAFLDHGREGMFTLVLQSHDLPATAEILGASGLQVSTATDSPDALTVEPSCTYGARFRIESV